MKLKGAKWTTLLGKVSVAHYWVGITVLMLATSIGLTAALVIPLFTFPAVANLKKQNTVLKAAAALTLLGAAITLAITALSSTPSNQIINIDLVTIYILGAVNLPLLALRLVVRT